MANNTFVGFPHGQSDTGIDAADVVKELQPVTTWNRDTGYTVTRRWRGPIDALVNFSDGGASNADFDGTYFTGTTGIILGGAGRDGAISTNLEREEGGQLGVFSATWVSSNIATRLTSGGQVPSDGSTSGDLYQESSLWFLDGNDLEKNILECPAMTAIIADISTVAQRDGFPSRVQAAVDDYKAGSDKDGNSIADFWEKKFAASDYFTAADPPYSELSAGSITALNLICQEMFKGVEAFTVSQYVLRNTVTTQYTSASGAQLLAPYYVDVNKIWDTSDLTTMMGASTRPIDPPTSTVAYTLPLIGLLSGSPFSTYKWLYRTPDVQQLGNGKWQITREWWETTDYSTILYDEK
tara:strand:- start:201 stop:1259 length:1059 start_codon:yes stop_codon:yes gene_type:complete